MALRVFFESPVGNRIPPAFQPGQFLRICGDVKWGFVPLPGAIVQVRIHDSNLRLIEQYTSTNITGDYWFDFDSFYPEVTYARGTVGVTCWYPYPIGGSEYVSVQFTIGEKPPEPDEDVKKYLPWVAVGGGALVFLVGVGMYLSRQRSLPK